MTRFHTYWLRQLLDSQLGWDNFLQYRQCKKSRFSSIGSNSLLTRLQYHTEEMLSGIEYQNPKLNTKETREIVMGAYQAIEANSKQYEQVLNY